MIKEESYFLLFLYLEKTLIHFLTESFKEEELRASMNLKYAHLSDDLHVEITAIAPPAEAYARIAFALAEVRKYLIPDNNDNIRQEQMREMEMTMSDDSVSNDRRPSMRGPSNLGNAPRPAARQALPRTSRGWLPTYYKTCTMCESMPKIKKCCCLYLMFIILVEQM